MSLYTMPCIIFAGGKSSRMGEDKAFLPFGDYNSLIEYQVQRLQKIFKYVYISAKDKNKFAHINVIVIEDSLYPDIRAPTTGFINTFNQLKDEDSFFILSVDTPFVNKSLISKFIEASQNGNEAIIAKTPSGIHPLCGVYTRALEEPIKIMIQKQNHKLRKLLQSSKVDYIDIPNEHLLSNLNTPEQYQKALKHLQK